MTKRNHHTQERDIVVVGFDTETWDGPPISLQFFSSDEPKLTRIIQVDAQTATVEFFKHLGKFDPAKHYRVYGHYLEFDLLSAYWSRAIELVRGSGEYNFTYRGWVVSGVYGRPTFSILKSKAGHYIEIVDSSLWFRGSLDNAAAQYCPDVRKFDRPKMLGQQWYSIDDSEFCEYAMRDAEIAARLGALVEGFHTSQELRPSVSLASQAAQIFRMRYIADPIHQCPTEYLEPALLAYHGGKNNLIPNAAPKWHNGMTLYDLSSAYPYAMSELPSFTDPDAYHEARLSATAQSVPTPGIYRVTGDLAPCQWPIFFSHSFKPLRACRVEDLWIHGYELNEALRTGEFTPRAPIKGLYYKGPLGESATARFARDFYKLKSTADNSIDRYMYKILLNSISGKFIQTQDVFVTEPDGLQSKQRVAGGLFHPFIAGAITAHTRAIMHRVEHAYKAIHTATDGIIAKSRKTLLPLGLPAEGLGSLNREMTGNIAMFRTKLYIGYTKEPTAAIPSRVFKDWYIPKFALHGFQGKVGELEEMMISNRRWYIAPHRISLREALKHGTVPNKFVNRTMQLQLGMFK